MSTETETETETESEPEAGLVIEVLDAKTDEPIGDAHVTGGLQDASNDTKELTGDVGSEGRIRGVEPGGSYEFTVSAEGYESEEIVVEHETESETHSIVYLKPVASVSEMNITVLDSDGDPIEGVDVTISGDELENGSIEAVTDEQGTVREPVPHGEYTIDVVGEHDREFVQVEHDEEASYGFHLDTETEDDSE